MGFRPTTKSGHNMFVMASLLQKALRRGDAEKAGYAAYEMLGGYDSTVWKRLLVVSAEDCWGVLTKEIAGLHQKHISANEGLKGYAKKTGYISVAISILSKALKSRDACYYSCNFIMSDNAGTGTAFGSDEEVTAFKMRLEGEGQGMFTPDPEPWDIFTHMLYQSIRNCDMENSGYAIKALIEVKPEMIWKVICAAEEDFTNGRYRNEIEALMYADDFVNKKLPPEKRDPLFQSKAIMILMYDLCGKYDTVAAVPEIRMDGTIDHMLYPYLDIRKCNLEDGVIPEYVYDVHTIQGKRAGHTDWEMNLVENDAMVPLQKAFFEEGSWELRYDYKNRVGICTEGEYLESLEYRKTHESNPAKKFIGWE